MQGSPRIIKNQLPVSPSAIADNVPRITEATESRLSETVRSKANGAVHPVLCVGHAGETERLV